MARRRLAVERGSPPPRRGGHTGPETLSPTQARIWRLTQADPALCYHVTAAFQLTGRLDADALAEAAERVVRRHEALRSNVYEHSGVPVQEASPDGHAVVRVDAPVNATHDWLAARAVEPIALSDGALRLALLPTHRDRHLLVVSIPHIVSDGWSMRVILREVSDAYRMSTAGGSTPPPAGLQHTDFVRWQREWLQTPVAVRYRERVHDELPERRPCLPLPPDPHARSSGCYDGGRVEFSIPGETAAALRVIARGLGTTLFPLLLAVFAGLLRAHGAPARMLLGTAVANRQRAEFAGVVGYLANIAPLWLSIPGDEPLGAVAQRLAKDFADVYAYQAMPIELLLDTPVELPISALFAMQNFTGVGLALPGVSAVEQPLPVKHTEFPLSLTVIDGGHDLSGRVSHQFRYYTSSTAQGFARSFVDALVSFAADPRKGVTHERTS